GVGAAAESVAGPPKNPLRKSASPTTLGAQTAPKKAHAAAKGLAGQSVRLDDRLGEGFGRLLRHVVADAGEDPVRVLAGVLLRVRGAVRERFVEVAADGHGGNGDLRSLEEPLLQRVVAALVVGEAEAPAVIVDDDGDVVRVRERRGRAGV